MNFLNHIKKLEKRGIISRKPHPIIPFILAFIIFIFAILHWIVVKIVEGKVK